MFLLYILYSSLHFTFLVIESKRNGLSSEIANKNGFFFEEWRQYFHKFYPFFDIYDVEFFSIALMKSRYDEYSCEIYTSSYFGKLCTFYVYYLYYYFRFKFEYFQGVFVLLDDFSAGLYVAPLM